MSTKYIHQQNIGVDKILPQTKSWCWHRSVSLLLGSAESAAADFSKAPLKISYFSLMVLLSLHAVVKWGIASSHPDFMGGISTVLYRLVVPARHTENVQNLGAYKNIGGHLKFTDFHQTIAVYLSAHRRPIKKWCKHKCSPSLSHISFHTHDLWIRIRREINTFDGKKIIFKAKGEHVCK